MAEQFEDIVVTNFTTSAAYQDPDHKAVFEFQFMLSRSAPPLWVQIAEQDVTWGGRVNPVIGRRASTHSDRIVVRCTADEAQPIKDKLNTQVLPTVNQEYRRHAAAAQASQAAADAQQQGILSDIEKAIHNQK